MADVFNKKKRSAVMRSIKSKNTSPELRIRTNLHRKGYRYVLHDKRLPGKPDIVLPKFNTIINVKGCFWHGHTCKDGHIPQSRINYWQPKIAKNKTRDKYNEKLLRKMGWQVINVWECQCMTAKTCVKTIESIIRKLSN